MDKQPQLQPQPQPQLHPYQAALQRHVEKTGVIVDCYEPAFPASMCGQDYILQNIYVLITHRGVAHTQYDMREFTLTPNTIVFIQPGHVIRLIDRSDDYTFSRLVLSPQMYNEMQFNTLTHSAANFHTMPVFMLSNEQKNNLMHLMEILAVITRHSSRDLAHHHQVLLAQLAVGYEFLNHYRNALNYKWTDSRKKNLANRFYNLVVAHYRESREVKYYAELLHLSPKYFSKVFQQVAGMSPADWIEQYVIAQAKRMIESQPLSTLKEIAYKLGFTEPTSFYRYFRHATGITAKQYRGKAYPRPLPERMGGLSVES